ncbi:universal stress protein, partial [Streptosporangium sp. NPDC048865]|uniref:universal stress protein n=1 Tax=Streptosporangium sp. NPDC048865 TaxID=3155766 RepID=UPI003424F6F5
RGRAPRLEVETLLEAGRVSEVLRRQAEDAEQLMPGSRRLGRFGSAVPGSAGHGVLHHAHCPVAVVRARGEA